MSGFLDRNARSIEAEYSRYIDGDLLGKLITKNLFINVLGYTDDQVHIPLGRYGDADAKYDKDKPNVVKHDVGDGHVTTDWGRITFEIKCARINIANRYLGQTKGNWAFANIRSTPAKVEKKFDVLIAIGLLTLGLEDDQYWKHLEALQSRRAIAGRKVIVDARPHEPEFLAICDFFILPRRKVKFNGIRLTIDAIEKSPYAPFRASGDDREGCRRLWQQAISSAKEV